MNNSLNRLKLNRFSIKDSYDNLPTGLCFSYENGMPILVNRAMHTLSCEITGRCLQNANEFKRIIENGDLPDGIERISDKTVLRFQNGEYITFIFSYLSLDNKKVMQITAENTTDLYMLAEKLRKKNIELEHHGFRLRKYNKNIQSLIRQQEFLATKMKVHDEIGRALLQTRQILRVNSSKENKKAVILAWKNVVDMLNFEIEEKIWEAPVSHLLSAAKSIGVEIKLKGDLSYYGNSAEIIAVAGSELLTNAVRHGGATELEIDCKYENTCQIIRFTSNGKQPEEKIKESGGLLNIRHKVENEGGIMKLEYEPKYSVIIILQKKGDDI